jgi:F-type H+-transporting ATPase subunit gamma
MASVRELRGRISSIQNIQKVTGAMKLIATVRQKKAQDRVNAARPYADKMAEVMQSLVTAAGGNPAALFAEAGSLSAAARDAEQLLARRDVRHYGLLVMSGERGLCGSYNTNVLRKAMEAIRGVPRESVRVVAVGRKATAFFQKRGYRIVEHEPMPASDIPFSLAATVGQAVRQLFITHDVDVVHLIYTRSLSAATQRPTATQLLPVEIAESDGARTGPSADFIYEPSAPDLLSALVPRYVDTIIYQAMLESLAGEHGARMVAMTNATENAGEFVKTLTLMANRARQAGITNELLEIVSGAEALRSS